VASAALYGEKGVHRLSSATTIPDWKAFEIAVAKFAAAMDPSAVVRHNVLLPDADTGHARQHDVIIEARICKIFPVTILVSCKYWHSKLDEGHIDTFIGEFLSSRAHKGVIYSYSGFTQPALEKAAAKGICCCRLFRNEPPEMPQSIPFRAYACSPSLTVTLLSPPRSNSNPSKWREVLSLSDETDGERGSVLDSILAAYESLEDHSMRQLKTNPLLLPVGFTSNLVFDPALPVLGDLKIQVGCVWKIFQADIKACLANGSYSLTQNQFVGDFSFPRIDRLNTHVGPGWNRLNETPKSLEPGAIVILLSGATNLRTDLCDKLGPQDINNPLDHEE
jgi:hypothetical protein